MDKLESTAPFRVFLPGPVPEAIIRDVLVRAARMSTIGDSLPWHVYVIAERQVQILEAKLTGWPRERIKDNGKTRPLRLVKRLQEYHFFGAPVVLLFAIEKLSQTTQSAGLGKYVHTIALLARRRGLQTFQLESSLAASPAVRRYLKLSKNLIIHSGVALGYAEKRATLNSEPLPRRSIDNFVTFLKFKNATKQTLGSDEKLSPNSRLDRKNKEPPSKRAIKPGDKYVGERIYARRIISGFTQTNVAKKLEISYQLFQKYESGATRVGAGRLQQLATVLEVPIDYFFKKTSSSGNERLSKNQIPGYVSEFLASPDGIRLLKAFVRIAKRKLSRSIVAFVEEVEHH